MNSDNLTRQAIRLAQRESRKRGHVLTREELLRLRVQTVDPWKRIVFIGFGALIAVLAIVVYLVGGPWWVWGPFAFVGLLFAFVGIFGRKEYLERELKKLGTEGPTALIDAVLNALI